MSSLQSAFKAINTLSPQTAVYVVFARREQRVHVMSTKVHPKYSITGDLNDCLCDRDEEECKEESKYIKSRVQEFGLNGTDDKSGFYNGVDISELGLLDLANEHGDGDIQESRRLDLLIPYHRYDMPVETVTTCIGNLPIVEDEEAGPLSLQKCHDELGDVAVSMNEFLTNYIICKIDQISYLYEVELDNDFVFPEIDICSHWNNDDLERVRDNALQLISALVDNVKVGGDWGYEPIDLSVRQTIRRGLNSGWEVTTHPHIVIP